MRWENPCFRSAPEPSSEPLPSMKISIADALRALSVKSTLQREAAIVLKSRYIPELGSRLTNSFLIQYLQTANMEGLNLVEESESVLSCNSNISTILLSDYRLLSTMAVFLEKVIEDEMYFEHGELYDVMETVQDKLYDLLCDLHTTIYTVVNGSIESHVGRDAMNEELRSLSEVRANRFYRDYTIINKNIQFLDHLSEKYQKLSTTQ
nr:uncharacterized protein LOC111137554 isoform X3 [Crassostrea virginica]XP_022344757.1 uncharacterized protein LOC111137554 isoform X3 [Crassostrea virginica]